MRVRLRKGFKVVGAVAPLILILAGCAAKQAVSEKPAALVERPAVARPAPEALAPTREAPGPREVAAVPRPIEPARPPVGPPGPERVAPRPSEEAVIVRRPPEAAVERAVAPLKDIFFDFDKYNLKPDARALLGENAGWLRANAGVKIQIEGHADERGTDEYNLALGERRAAAAREYLKKLGIEPNRLTTITYGEFRPADSGHNEEAWTKNRRDHFVILAR